MIDTHAHVFSTKFSADQRAMLDRARQAGVQQVLMPNIDSDTLQAMMDLNAALPDFCLPMMGLHPTHVKPDTWQAELALVKEQAPKPEFVGVGEIGLDYYWDTEHAALQRQVFRQQLQLAKEIGKPVSIHMRDSLGDGLDIVEHEQDGRLSGVFHCFIGSVEEGQRAIAAGLYLGIGGVSTFKNGGLLEVLPQLPLDKMVLETDAPYLAPVPHRGKRNEPAYLADIANQLAQLYQVPVAQVKEVTTRNAKLLFGL